MITRMTETTVGEGVITIETPPSVAGLILGHDEHRVLLDGADAVLDLEKLGAQASRHVYQGQHGEMIAQAALALRAVEDARMRLGKVLQYGATACPSTDRKEAP